MNLRYHESESVPVAGVVEEKKRGIFKKVLFGLFVAVVVVLVIAFVPPSAFPVYKPITIEKGSSLSSLSETFKSEHVVNSATLLRLLVRVLGNERSVESGDYMFDHRMGLVPIALRIAHNDHGIAITKVTIPEGTNSSEIAKILENSLPAFDSQTFLVEAKKREGYLFPDTYLLGASIKPKELIEKMQDNFTKKTAPLVSQSASSGHSFFDIIVMASILEKEARTPESRAIISGILWKRLSIGMPLQVDATLGYVLPKGSSNLTLDDLNTDSAFNTYRNKGLPPAPIANPGLDAINEALHPKASPYLYYLSDSNGEMHYAITFDEHKANKARYLR